MRWLASKYKHNSNNSRNIFLYTPIMNSYRSRGVQNGNAIMTAVTLPNVITTNNVSSNKNNHNNNSFSNSNSSSQNLNLSTEPSKFANIKIEESSASLLENCSFVPTTSTVTTATVTAGSADKKTDTSRGLMSAFLAGQIIQQHQQQHPLSQHETNWNYLTDTNGNGVSSATSITVACDTPNTTAGDTLYNELVDCVNAANAVNQSSTHNHHQTNADEEDDDPIHTFLNIESYFEKELITLIQQEDMIYNYSNQNYRNVKLKLEVWDEIARKLKKPGKHL